MKTKCGYVGLLGRPNAGKSTLLNACLGQKIAGVSQKPQTTRNRIVGIDTVESCQILFLDTPGLHRSQGKPRINKMMNREAWGILGDADLICYLIDGSKGWHAEDGEYVASILQTSAAPILLLVTKADAAKSFVIDRNSDVILGKIQEICGDDPAKKSRFLTPMPYLLSAKRPEEINEFRAYLAEFMPEGPFLYDPENLTDRPETFVIAEMIREQVFRHLGEELPYETSVVVESLEPGPTTRVAAMIIVGRESHKPIVIGQGGRTIKAIGTAARQTLERHFDGRVFLELFVRVQTNWINDPSLVSELQSLDL